MRIYLIGFMGSGKSYLGKALASQLNLSYLDLDDWLEKEEGRSISRIFSESGEMEFRKLEAQYLRATAQHQNIVVATGGGTPCFFENMDWANENGVTIYLNASPRLIASRLSGEKSKRPLISSLNDEELLSFIENKLAERESFYHQAHLQLDIWEDGTEAIAEIAGYLKRFIPKA